MHKAERTEPRDYRMRVRRKFQPIVIVRTDKAPGESVLFEGKFISAAEYARKIKERHDG